MISVIVAVYNVQGYLEDCVKGLMAQTVTDLEIVLVDDGSTDRSGDLCDVLAAADPRIRVVHKENGGLMSAWQEGVRCSIGEYIGFVDSDDTVDADMFERLHKTAIESNADITLCGLVREYDTHSERETMYLSPGVYDRRAIEEIVFPQLLSTGTMLNRGLSPNRVTKLFKRDVLLRNIPLCDTRISLGEDLVTTFACVCDANTIAVCDHFFPYHYRIRGTSIMGSYNPAFFEQSVLLNEVVTAIAKQKQVYDFSVQLANDLVSLAYYGMERNLSARHIATSQKLRYVKSVIRDERLRRQLSLSTLSKNNRKCALYEWLVTHSCAWGLYALIVGVVLPIRNRKKG